MLRRNIADRLQGQVCARIAAEQSGRILTKGEIEAIWFQIYGKLCRGESEKDVEAWCRTAPIGRWRKR